jgi:hypothetical protein
MKFRNQTGGKYAFTGDCGNQAKTSNRRPIPAFLALAVSISREE